MSDGWDPSIVDFAAPADGFLVRAFGGRSGALAIENGAELTFPYITQQQIASTVPGSIVATDLAGSWAEMTLRGPTGVAGSTQAEINMLGLYAGAGGGSILDLTGGGTGANLNTIRLADNEITLVTGTGLLSLLNNQLHINTEGTVWINTDATLGTSIDIDANTSVSITANTSISISNDTTTGTTITIDSNGALNLVGVPVNINGVDVSTALGQWTAYTPTVKQNGSTVNSTVTYSRRMKLGRTVIFQCLLAVIASGTAGTTVSVSLPFTGVTAYVGGPISGTFYIYDASAGVNYLGEAILGTGATDVFGISPVTSSNYLGAAYFTAALASGDSVLVSCVYEAAS